MDFPSDVELFSLVLRRRFGYRLKLNYVTRTEERVKEYLLSKKGDHGDHIDFTVRRTRQNTEFSDKLWSELEEMVDDAIEDGSADSFPATPVTLFTTTWGTEKQTVTLSYFKKLKESLEDMSRRYDAWRYKPDSRVAKWMHPVYYAGRPVTFFRAVCSVLFHVLCAAAIILLTVFLPKIKSSLMAGMDPNSNLYDLTDFIGNGLFLLMIVVSIGAVIFTFWMLSADRELFWVRGKYGNGRKAADEALLPAYKRLRFYTLWSETLDAGEHADECLAAKEAVRLMQEAIETYVKKAKK